MTKKIHEKETYIAALEIEWNALCDGGDTHCSYEIIVETAYEESAVG